MCDIFPIIDKSNLAAVNCHCCYLMCSNNREEAEQNTFRFPWIKKKTDKRKCKAQIKVWEFFFLINSNVFKDIFYYYHRHSFSLLLLKMKKICCNNYDFVIIEMMMKILLKIEKSLFFLFCLCFILYKIYIFFSIHWIISAGARI